VRGHTYDVEQKKQHAAAPSTPATAAPKSAGEPLAQDVRERMESRFGFDFSSVRVHASSRDAEAADALGATAFTVGTHVVFGHGAYAPGSETGERLIAHELTHVVQNVRSTGSPTQSLTDPGDAAEREADRIADGGQSEVRHALSATIARQTPSLAPPPNVVTQSAPPVFNVFEVPDAITAAGAPAAFDKYLQLNPADQERARNWSYSTGNLRRALQALGPVKSADPKYAGVVYELLRWIEETETRKSTGKSDADIAKTQSGFIKPAGASAPQDWGGTANTRWAGLLPKAQKDWTDRGKKAIDAMVAYTSTAAPELKLTTATFELEFERMDANSLGAMAMVGSKPGETVAIGFEFVVAVEVNPAYALSTVVHELKGHPMYDDKNSAPTTYAGKLYQASAALVPSSKNIDRSGVETFNYWPSEIYSLLKEIPYWKAVTPADAAKKLKLPKGTATVDNLNYDPRGGISDKLANMRTFWEPSLVNGVVRGFYKRIQADPSMQKVSVTEFEALVRAEFPATDAAAILK
jgi:hypothetical protein